MFPVFSLADVIAATSGDVLAEARVLATQVEDLGSDEWSVWGQLGDIDAGSLLLHHTERPLVGECPCAGSETGLCVHVTALALAELGDTDDLRIGLNELSKDDLVTMLCEIADQSPHGRLYIQVRIG